MNRPTGKAQMDRYFIGGETAISSKNLYPRYRVYEAGISGTRINNKQYISTIGKGKYIYRASRWECARLRKNVPYVKVHRSNPKHLYPKFNGYGDNGERKLWSSSGSPYCNCSACCYPYTAHVRPSVSQPSQAHSAFIINRCHS